MRELTYTILELEEWCSSNSTCNFCPGLKRAICQIRTRSKLTDKIVQNDKACENCKEKFENDELPKCSCGRLRNGYSCDCKEESQEKELPILPHERRPNAFYEQQINSLQEQLNEAEWTIAMEREEVEKFHEKSEEWSKNQKQELLDRIKELEEENKQLKTQSSEELIKEIEQLKTQLEQLTSQQTAQIEVKETKKWPWKLKK